MLQYYVMYKYLTSRKARIEYISTEVGELILQSLKNSGWKVRKQYNILAFDKGIDYDSYTLKKGRKKLYFKWTNWFEWEIKGSADDINQIAHEYDLKVT